MERLRYFVPRLRHPEQFIADDAYAEFARTDYPVVQELKPYLSRTELREWIEDEKTNNATPAVVSHAAGPLCHQG